MNTSYRKSSLRFFPRIVFVSLLSFSLLGSIFPRAVLASSLEINYSTYFGGNGYDQIHSMAVDSNNYIYLTGETASSNFPVVNSYQPSVGLGNTVFVSKFTPDGQTLVYSTLLGGTTGHDSGWGVAANSNGEACVVSYVASYDFPTLNAYKSTKSGSSDAVIMKLSATGELIYSTYFGGDDSDEGIAKIDIDNYGNCYIAGRAGSSGNFPLVNSYQSVISGQSDAFAAKFDTNGGLVYSSVFGSSTGDVATDIVVDKVTGEAYISGATGAPNNDFPIVNGFQSTYGGGGDAFVLKLSSAGNTILYSSYIGGSGSDYSNGIDIDAAGNAYVVGRTTSSDFTTTPNAFLPTVTDTNNAFVIKVNTTGGALEYSSYYGGSAFEEAYAVAVDSTGMINITGMTSPNGALPLVNEFDDTFGGAYEGFFAQVDPNGTLITSSYLGGDNLDAGFHMAIGSNDQVNIAGVTTSSDFPTVNPFSPSFGGQLDGFITRIGEVVDSPSYDDFVVLGHEGVNIDDYVIVNNGDVGSTVASTAPYLDNTVQAETVIGKDVVFNSPESKVFGDTLRLKQNSVVHDIYFNSFTSGPNATWGSEFSPLLSPTVPSFPEVPSFSAGSTNVTVLANTSYNLASGDYQDLIVRSGATLTLTGGVYNFNSWDLKTDSTVYFSAPTEVRIVDKLAAGSTIRIEPSPSSGLSASDLKVYVTGINGITGALNATPKAVRFGPDSILNANFYVPNGTLLVQADGILEGAFIGKWVSIGQRSQLTYNNGF